VGNWGMNHGKMRTAFSHPALTAARAIQLAVAGVIEAKFYRPTAPHIPRLPLRIFQELDGLCRLVPTGFEWFLVASKGDR